MTKRITEIILDGLTPADLIENISAVLDLATADEWRDGVAWYGVAHRIGGALGRECGRTGPDAYSVGAGILAALSPAKGWDSNVEAARIVAAGGIRKPNGARVQTGVNLDKARRVIEGGHPLDVLGGLKVLAFYECILDPSTPTAVCIDRHAVSLAYGRHLTDVEAPKRLSTAARYEAVADAYRAVAAARGMRPCDVQAVTWVAWRNLKAGTGTRTFKLAAV